MKMKKFFFIFAFVVASIMLVAAAGRKVPAPYDLRVSCSQLSWEHEYEEGSCIYFVYARHRQQAALIGVSLQKKFTTRHEEWDEWRVVAWDPQRPDWAAGKSRWFPLLGGVGVLNYPNPFNAETTISYSLPKDVEVSLTIFDITGREVVTLVDSFQNAGDYQVNWKAGNLSLSSGIYFCRLTAGSFTVVKRMNLIK